MKEKPKKFWDPMKHPPHLAAKKRNSARLEGVSVAPKRTAAKLKPKPEANK